MCVCWHGILFKEPNANGSRASDLIGLCRQHTKPNPQHTSDNKERQGRQGNPNRWKGAAGKGGGPTGAPLRRGRRWEGGNALCDTARAGVRRVGARSRPGQGPSVVRKPRRGPAWPKLARQATVATPAWPCCARTGKAGAARRGRWATRTLGRRGRAHSGRRAAALSTVGWAQKRTRVIRLQCIRV